MEVQRKQALETLTHRLRDNAVVAVPGPRQCGKTTLARQFARKHAPSKIHFFDLENPKDLAKLENPILALGPLRGIVILDEIQRRPELFPVLRVLVDQPAAAKYIILGSASRDLIAQSSETLDSRRVSAVLFGEK